MTYTKDRTLLASLAFADKDKKEPLHDLAGQFLLQPEIAAQLMTLLNINTASTTDIAEYWQSVGNIISAKEHCPHKHKAHTQVQCRETVRCEYDATFIGGRLEVPLIKGSGQYRSMIGFVDGVLHYELAVISRAVSSEKRCQFDHYRDDPSMASDGWIYSKRHTHPTTKTRENYRTYAIPFEIKIHRESVGNILRQIKLYEEFIALADDAFTGRDLENARRAHKDPDPPLWVLAVAYDVTAAEQEAFAAEHIHCVRLGAGFDAFVAAQTKRNETPAKVMSL